MSTTPGEPWARLLRSSDAINGLYAVTPGLSVLHEALLRREGPRAELRIELDRYPDSPPKRWHPSFNRVQIVLCFDDLRAIEILRWGWEGQLDRAEIHASDGLVRFDFTGPDVAVRGAGVTMDVLSVSGYAV